MGERGMDDRAVDDHEPLIAAYGVSRPLVVQWTVVSVLGVVVSLFGFGLLYHAVNGSAGPIAFVATPETGWWNVGLTVLALATVVVAVVVPHELCHGLAIRAFGGRPRYGLGVAYAVVPYAFATTETRFSRNQFVVIALAPLVVLSALGVPAMLAFEWPWLAVPLAMNAGGAVGDVWMALTILGYPDTVTVRDTTTGLEVYGPGDCERIETAPTAVLWDLLVGIAGATVTLALAGGVVVPIVLTAIGVEAFALGVPETPLLIVEFVRTPDGGVEFAMGSGVFALGIVVGLCYAYVRSRLRS
ncbi:DUF3267 domain-containing protein [Halococcoides cellulosivorans]|nr:DUF3267 domain-containing protein [Halococcoides cellulosivorans]